MTVQIVTTNCFGGSFPSTEKLSVFSDLIQVDTLDGKFEVPISDYRVIITVKADNYVNAFIGACALAVKGIFQVLVKDKQITCEGLEDCRFRVECKGLVVREPKEN